MSINQDKNPYAILGPTNTGKTHLALERMLSFSSGMFGFPLRLLARENYDRAISKIGKEEVALITGEEKIIPENPKYFFCTVESMPISKSLEFVAIDEVQLASDFERGYIFTDRIMNLRGKFETLFLGSSTIENLLRQLFPKIKIEKRDRLSKLSYTKRQTISKLKPRTAVIAFNINDIYSIAEKLRSQKGGAAVVLGALSPRTRNYQVEMYEKQNVDYIVATDAIGMGLNLNIKHVAFSSLKKFDGNINRNLKLTEIAQIAGRAGRYNNDGTFGLTSQAPNIDPVSIESIENNIFDSIKKIYWRNSEINYTSIKALVNSLDKNPPSNFFIKKKNAEDEKSFKSLINDDEIIKYLKDKDNIKILWDVCKIPDFQKLMTESYFEFLKKLFIYLMQNNNFLPDQWINENVTRLDNINGDIDILSKRIAYIRTWTFISNHAKWIKDKEYWVKITRKIEDRLSDELHNKLKIRFVDQGATYFVDNIKKRNNLKLEIKKDNFIDLKGSIIGKLKGFKLELNEEKKSNISNLLSNAAKKTILTMIPERVNELTNAPDEAFHYGDLHNIKMNKQPNIYWGDDVVGFFEKGKNIFSPKINIDNTDMLDNENKKKILQRLNTWFENKIENLLKPINQDTNKISEVANVRSIAYNLFNDLGCSHKMIFQIDINKMTTEEKKELSRLGIRTGIEYFYLTSFMKKNAIEFRALLWNIYNSSNKDFNYPLPHDGRVYFNINAPNKSLNNSYWQSIGYIRINNFAVRVDIFERIFFLVRQKYKFGPFIQHPELMNLIGCNINQLKELMSFLNYSSIKMANDQICFFYKNEDKSQKNKQKSDRKNKLKNNKLNKNINSPFNTLESYFRK